MMFYSPSTRGFYTVEIHGINIPQDAIEITSELHAWLMQEQAQGKVIQPGADGIPVAVTPPPAVLTLKDYDIAIERHLDAGAKDAGYYDPLDRIPNIDRACSYASFDNPYQAEGQSFVAWRAAVWAYVYQVKLDVDAELRTQPTIDELLTELPIRQIPA